MGGPYGELKKAGGGWDAKELWNAKGAIELWSTKGAKGRERREKNRDTEGAKELEHE
jgi:hypothetical protein